MSQDEGTGRDEEEVANWQLTDRVSHEEGRGDPFAAAVRGTRMPMVITDARQPDNPIVFAHEAFQRLTGYAREEIIGRNCRFLQGPKTRSETVKEIRDALERVESLQVTLLNYRKDGSTFWNELYMSPVYGEDGELQFFFSSQVDVTDRVEALEAIDHHRTEFDGELKRRTETLNRELRQKTTLLRELDHRVKNTLGTISALINMASRGIADDSAADKLAALRTRVDTVGNVHSRLFELDNYHAFDGGALVRDLSLDIVNAMGRDDVRVDSEVEQIDMRAVKATPLGLAVNEVVTNALKYGLPQGDPVLTIRAHREGDEAVITLADNGPGFDRNTRRSGSMGQALVERLMLQLDGHAVWNTSARGTKVTLTIPLAAH